MYLSQLTGKNIRVGKNLRGVCVGVGISLKSKTVKYLLCSSQATSCENNLSEKANNHADFAVSVIAIENISDDEISLSALRAVFPKNCAKIFIGKPIYSDEGVYLGKVADMESKWETMHKIVKEIVK